MVFGTVGAYDWSGGLMEYVDGKQVFINVSQAENDMKDSYLGYSVAGANVSDTSLYIVGAPRYLHKGKVVIFSKNLSTGSWAPIQHINGQQIGAYFGCELCSVDLTQDGGTDLLLIGAPLYHDYGVGGMVRVCVVRNLENLTCTDTLYGKAGNVFGRFGSAISELRDVNGDGINDVAIGAPLEDEHAGCLYIFNGERHRINPVYSQRISAVSRAGLKYLGQSIHGIWDLTGDGLTDLAVGALGTALVFRSRPVINVTASVTFRPQKIPLEDFLCNQTPLDFQGPVTNASICFHLLSPGKPGEMSIHLTYRLDLDSERQQRRVTFSASQRSLTRNLSISQKEICVEQNIFIPVSLSVSLLSPPGGGGGSGVSSKLNWLQDDRFGNAMSELFKRVNDQTLQFAQLRPQYRYFTS
uniref:Integrin alpha-L-like n=1 Tax=Callorhinchus milii TaxID=7868 RepID=A0A4W3GK78_CALMI